MKWWHINASFIIYSHNVIMKIALIAVAILLLGGIGFIMWDAGAPTTGDVPQNTMTVEETVGTDDNIDAPSVTLPDGTYALVPSESTFMWAGKKPLIDGYINTGSIAVLEGSLSVEEGQVRGVVVLDMTTLAVSETPKKPGQESALEGHLKGERWFDVATYPTAEVSIVSVTPTSADMYDVSADLTLHGQTHAISFPASVNVDGSGRIVASAAHGIDRTQWGITAGSGSFFDNLADNVVDDMVAISLTIVAEPRPVE